MARAKRLWIAVTAGHGLTLSTMLLAICVTGLLLPAVVAVPALASNAVARPSAVLLAWFVAVLAVHTGEEPSWQIMATARSRVRVLNVGRVIGTASVGGALAGVLTENWRATASCTAALLGLGLVGASLLGHRHGWSLPTLHLFSAFAVGGAGGGVEPPAWAWILDASPGPREALWSLGLVAIGCLAWWRASPSFAAEERA